MTKQSDQDEERLAQLLEDLRKVTDAMRNHAAAADASQRLPTIPSRQPTDKTH